MLKMIDCQDCGDVEYEFGDYLPFKIWQNGIPNGRNIYWRTGNFKSTLLELEIDRITSQIVSLSLVLPGKIKDVFPDLYIVENFRLQGFPKVSTEEWPSNGFKDEIGSFNIFADSNCLLIALSEEMSLKGIIFKSNVVFGVDGENNISLIMISNLNEDKMTEFRKSCN